MAINLSSFSTIDGFKATSSASNGQIRSVGYADVNGDGFKDMLFGTPNQSPAGRASAGVAYVLFGKNDTFHDTELSTMGTGVGCFIVGATANDLTGSSIAGVGSLTSGSPYESFLLGAPSISGVGKTWLFKGAANFCSTGIINLGNTLATSVVVKITGASVGDRLGSYVDGGDFDGDGDRDLLVTAWGSSSNNGKAYILYNDGTGFTSNIDLSTLAYPAGVVISGRGSTTAPGFYAKSAGYFNNDNITDIVAANTYESEGSGGYGAAAIVMPPVGGLTSNINLLSLSNTVGFLVTGDTNYRCGASASPAGNNKVAIGCPGAGCVTVVTYDNSTTYSIIGLPITSPYVHDICSGSIVEKVGSALSFGNFNNDTLVDLLIGLPKASPNGLNNAGAAAVVYGQVAPANVTLGNLTVAQGFDIFGDTSLGEAGTYLGSVGDVNGNGKDDLAVVDINTAFIFCGCASGDVVAGSTGSPSSSTTSSPSGSTTSSPSSSTTSSPSGSTTSSHSSPTTSSPSGSTTASPSPSSSTTSSDNSPTSQPESVSSADHVEYSFATILVAGVAMCLMGDIF
jgi:hypothetical protein